MDYALPSSRDRFYQLVENGARAAGFLAAASSILVLILMLGVRFSTFSFVRYSMPPTEEARWKTESPNHVVTVHGSAR
jgi:hypothetical protein